jgi:hypothetical protein
VQIRVSVWNKDTKWGDSIYLCSDFGQWQRNCELTTTPETFPWWCGVLTLQTDKVDKHTLEYKFLVWRDYSYPVWENFTGNRKQLMNVTDELILVNKFGEKSWLCPLCGTAVVDEKPVVCDKLQHAMHQECFELYIADELNKKNTDVKCMKCLDPLPANSWQPIVNQSICQRYKRVLAENRGATVIRCPMVDCNFEIIFNEDGGNSEVVPECAVCGKCDARWCISCDRKVEDDCKICLSGMKDIAQKIFDALEDAAGVKCPDCQQRGQKLPSECTHITCDCGTVFCYCCGLKGEEVDTSDPYASSSIDRLYGHNDEYQHDEKRCPMWLVNFGDLITDWPSEVEDAQKKFHKMKATKKLKQVREEIDEWEWEAFMQLDDNVKNLVEKYLNKTYPTC